MLVLSLLFLLDFEVRCIVLSKSWALIIKRPTYTKGLKTLQAVFFAVLLTSNFKFPGNFTKPVTHISTCIYPKVIPQAPRILQNTAETMDTMIREVPANPRFCDSAIIVRCATEDTKVIVETQCLSWRHCAL